MIIPPPAVLLEHDQQIPGTRHTVGDFWRWGFSDLRENVVRGLFVEFLVAKALGDPAPVRRSWQAFDVTSADGIRVEVKSAAYLQSWSQKELSRIAFTGLMARAWSYDTNVMEPEPGYQADVYVFVLNTCQEHQLYDPFDLNAYEFYVVSVDDLVVAGSPKALSLAQLRRFNVSPVALPDLRVKVRELDRPDGAGVSARRG